jgi:hypothetical protein
MHSHSQSFVSALNKTGTPLRTRTRARGYTCTRTHQAHTNTRTRTCTLARAHTHTHIRHCADTHTHKMELGTIDTLRFSPYPPLTLHAHSSCPPSRILASRIPAPLPRSHCPLSQHTACPYSLVSKYRCSARICAIGAWPAVGHLWLLFRVGLLPLVHNKTRKSAPWCIYRKVIIERTFENLCLEHLRE